MQIYKTKKQITAALTHLCERDKKLASAFEKYGTPPMRESPDGFHGLVRLLISQQVSTAAATSIQAKFDAAMGGMEPENLLALSEAAVFAQPCRSHRQRWARLKGAAQSR
jgi:DNA-3-methyladenine glycosylase II